MDYAGGPAGRTAVAPWWTTPLVTAACYLSIFTYGLVGRGRAAVDVPLAAAASPAGG